jgi:hypothetical protein
LPQLEDGDLDIKALKHSLSSQHAQHVANRNPVMIEVGVFLEVFATYGFSQAYSFLANL